MTLSQLSVQMASSAVSVCFYSFFLKSPHEIHSDTQRYRSVMPVRVCIRNIATQTVETIAQAGCFSPRVILELSSS